MSRNSIDGELSYQSTNVAVSRQNCKCPKSIVVQDSIVNDESSNEAVDGGGLDGLA